MTDLQPCLSGCDQALAEAELLIASLEYGPARLEVELSGIRDRIATLRREVERLRGMKGPPIRKKEHPNRTNLTGSESPWCLGEPDLSDDASSASPEPSPTSRRT